jgi:hypothetical protein
MHLKSESPHTLLEFIQDIGIPSHLHSDNAKELTSGKLKQLLSDFQIKHTTTEPHSPWKNRAENAIKEIKKHTVRLMSKTKPPYRVWDYCITYVSEIKSITANDLYSLHGWTPHEMVTGNMQDISEYTDYSWYTQLWFCEATAFPASRRILGRWLGVAHRVGQALCYWVLTNTGQMIARTTVQALPKEELATVAVQNEIQEIGKLIMAKLGDSFASSENPAVNEYLQDIDDDVVEPAEPEAVMPEADTFDIDSYLSAQVQLPKGDGYQQATVLRQKHDADGNPIGIANNNPILDTRVYEVQFPDGHTEEYAANIISENLYAQVDNEGFYHLVLNEILDHRKLPNAIPIDDGWITSANWNCIKRKTMKGWDICVSWKDGSTSWEPLCNLKESNPIELAEYAIANKIAQELAFAWWVPYTLKKRDRIILAIKSRYAK